MTPPIKSHYSRDKRQNIAQFLDLIPTFNPTDHITDDDEQKLLGLIWRKIIERDTIQNLHHHRDGRMPHESLIVTGDEISDLFSNQAYSHVIKSLQSKGLIHRKSRDIDEGECFRYCIRSEGWKAYTLGITRRSQKPSFPKIINDTRNTKAGKGKEEEELRVDLITLIAFRNQLSKIRLNKHVIKKLKNWESWITPTQLVSYQRTIRAIVTGDHWVTYSEQGRLYSSFTNMPKAIRRNLEIQVNGKWEKLIELDIRACFPTLLAYFYLKPHYLTPNDVDEDALRQEFKEFKRIIKEEEFYKYVFGAMTKDRDKIKVGFSCYCNGYYTPKWNYHHHLKEKLPLLADMLHFRIGMSDERERTFVGRTLHRIESEIMIRDTLQPLGDSNFASDAMPLLTVHDAILTTSEHTHTIIKHVQDLFEKTLKIRPVIIEKTL